MPLGSWTSTDAGPALRVADGGTTAEMAPVVTETMVAVWPAMRTTSPIWKPPPWMTTGVKASTKPSGGSTEVMTGWSAPSAATVKLPTNGCWSGLVVKSVTPSTTTWMVAPTGRGALGVKCSVEPRTAKITSRVPSTGTEVDPLMAFTAKDAAVTESGETGCVICTWMSVSRGASEPSAGVIPTAESWSAGMETTVEAPEVVTSRVPPDQVRPEAAS